MRLKLLQALVKPCLLYGVQTWKLTPELVAKIIAAERSLTRWCLRMTKQASTAETQEENLETWIQWKADTAREIARLTEKNKCTRWHITALRLHWQWAGHAARRPGTANYEAVTAHRTPTRRGRPQAQWSSLIRSFSTKELHGNADSWIDLARDKAAWIEFCKYFTDFVEANVLREDTRATLARDARAVTQAQAT